MPNIASVFKQEISRLSRREIRSEVAMLKRSSAQFRKHIASMRRQLDRLEKHLRLVAKHNANAGAQTAGRPEPGGKRLRFRVKALVAQRSRIGLSAADFGRLIGVTANSVYNWERGASKPRPRQLERIAALRGVGKREAQVRLGNLGASVKSAAVRGR